MEDPKSLARANLATEQARNIKPDQKTKRKKNCNFKISFTFFIFFSLTYTQQPKQIKNLKQLALKGTGWATKITIELNNGSRISKICRRGNVLQLETNYFNLSFNHTTDQDYRKRNTLFLKLQLNNGSRLSKLRGTGNVLQLETNYFNSSFN